jgi:hypothetical protein
MADMQELYQVPNRETFRILVARGVVKWLIVRRKLIRLKDIWKLQETSTQATIVRTKELMKDSPRDSTLEYQLAWNRGYLACAQERRRDVRNLCHSPRWPSKGDIRDLEGWGKTRTPMGEDTHPTE